MKETVFLVVLLTLPALGLPADHARVGFIAGLELEERSGCEAIAAKYHDCDGVIPGLYWEVIPDHLGYGMTCHFWFERQESLLPEIDYQWYLDWIATWDLRIHPFRWSFLDPFLELGLECAGKADITDYEEYGMDRDCYALFLSLFTQVGWGLGFRLGSLDLGARTVYRFWNEPPPNTGFEPYPLKDYHFDLYGGLRF